MFAFGAALSLAALLVAGVMEPWHLALAVALLPGTLLGVAASGPLSRRVDAGWLRPAVLGFAAVAAVVAIVSGL